MYPGPAERVQNLLHDLSDDQRCISVVYVCLSLEVFLEAQFSKILRHRSHSKILLHVGCRKIFQNGADGASCDLNRVALQYGGSQVP